MIYTDHSKEISGWVISNPPFIPRQKVAVSAASVFCLLSTVVCAPMGGAGGQSLFKTDNDLAYWPFLVLSPILILLLCGRASYQIAKSETAPPDLSFEMIGKPSRTLPILLAQYLTFLALSCLAGAFNAYNTMQYVPYWLAVFCVGPALVVPGFPLIPAFIEYHKRIWTGLNWLVHNTAWRKKQLLQPEQRLIASKRQYRQLPVEQRREANAVFTHPYTNPKKKIEALFDPFQLLKKPPLRFDKPKLAYIAGILGFIIGTVAELYAFQFGRQMAAPTGPVVSTLFGIAVAYVRIGISAVATMDVFTDIVDDVCYFSYTRNKSGVTMGQGFMRLGLFALALTSALPNVQNQIQTMGHEGFFGHVLAICAMIAPACIFFWAGDLVFRDYLYDTPGVSYMDCHDRLFNNVNAFKEEYYQALPRAEKTLLSV